MEIPPEYEVLSHALTFCWGLFAAAILSAAMIYTRILQIFAVEPGLTECFEKAAPHLGLNGTAWMNTLHHGLEL